MFAARASSALPVMLLTALLTHAGLPARAQPAATWVVDPLVAQPDLPPAGRSTFDRLIAAEGSHGPVFPFEALLAHIGRAAGVDALGRPGLKAVLVPAGRSLQRLAAAPEFFRFPRIVLAVDGEPLHARAQVPLLKDRLYVGYQEKAGVLEVISYNEEAARFEFQVVKNYRSGARPQVFYARRAICISCHQNHAPIFSRQQWDETNANPRIAAALSAQGRRYFGIPALHGVDRAYAIDNAVNRSNLFAAWQRLWQEGCGPDDEDGMRCRAGAFLAMLESRLSGGPFDRGDTAWQAYRRRIVRRWLTLWPGGLAIANASVPNRDALPADAISKQPIVAIHAAFEPLALRAPLEQWSPMRGEDVDRMVSGLGEFFSGDDMRALDRSLTAAGRGAPARSHSTRCSGERKAMPGAGFRLILRCPAAGDAGDLALRARLYLANATTIGSATIERLRLEREDTLPELTATRAVVAKGIARLSVRGSSGMARTAQGHRIEAIVLDLSAQPMRATVIWREDFELVRGALERMIAGRAPALGSGPIRRHALLDALYAAMRVAPPRTTKSAVSFLAPPRVEQLPDARGAPGEVATGDALDLTGFYRACATCHDTPDAFPPNFLHGDEGEVAAQIRECAPRIRARLRMWQRAAGQRIRTPMPPPLGLRLLNVTPGEWSDGVVLKTLLRQADSLDDAHRPLPMTEEDYDGLPACLGHVAAMHGTAGAAGTRQRGQAHAR